MFERLPCVCCSINELRPHREFRLDPWQKDLLSAASTTSFNMTSKANAENFLPTHGLAERLVHTAHVLKTVETWQVA